MNSNNLNISTLRDHLKKSRVDPTYHAEERAKERNIEINEVLFRILKDIGISYVKPFFDNVHLEEAIKLDVTLNDGRSILVIFCINRYDKTKIVIKTLHEFDPEKATRIFEKRPAREWIFEAA